jgi:predicted ATPase
MKTKCLCPSDKNPKCYYCPNNMKRYIITGGPGIGKTTVIEILASKGYRIVPEAARMVIEEEEIKGSDVLPWVNLQKFQEVVAERQMYFEETNRDQITIHDRGIIDGFAYSSLGGVKHPEIIEKLGRGRYEKVFILDPLPFYVDDPSRRETREEGLKIHDAIIKAYSFFDYSLIIVPVLSPEERVDFIISHL